VDKQINENKALLPPTLPRWWRVLPSLILLMIIGTIDSLILNDFIEYRYTSHYQVNSSSITNRREICVNASGKSHNSTDLISTTMSPNDRIQASTARLNVFISLAANIPSILTAVAY
jgi:hypothetical protein